MYIPASFAEPDHTVLLDFMEANPLGALVTSSPAHGLYATHLPLVIDRQRGPHGVLQGHIARANPHCRMAADTSDAMVIFTGPEAYITPAWYASKARDGKVVPTWNYVAVHVTGTMKFISEPEFLLAHLTQLTDTHEAGRALPWSISDAPAEYVKQLAGAIVGVEIEIRSLEGKWKLSQNRPDDDIDGVINGLRVSTSTTDHTVADLVAARRPVRTDPDAKQNSH
ncbi:MAG: FMN-binding negative transcriptional regulator [Gemmatimonadaceae bacterium]|nr:FMN-binding negative transcriptional regulator [Gemmatimonadaceae bacterium]